MYTLRPGSLQAFSTIQESEKIRYTTRTYRSKILLSERLDYAENLLVSDIPHYPTTRCESPITHSHIRPHIQSILSTCEGGDRTFEGDVFG